jgi:hypothetical protein
MQTFTVELIDDQAIPLLKQLEKINWLRIVESKPFNVKNSNKKEFLKIKDKENSPTFRFGGTISKEIATSMREQLNEIRDTWERNI